MRVLVGMSGGIDSTYAALKLMEEGHTVEGAVLIMHEYTELDAAKEAAESIGIPLHTVDCRKEFEAAVIPNFIEEYQNARTPNPCIICNSDVKFKVLCEYAEANGFDKIATGHYADIVKIDSDKGVRYALKRAKDAKKDQTYMLWRLTQPELRSLVLPLAGLTKEEIRIAAEARGLTAANRKDSQEICFIPSGEYAEFIEERVGPSAEGDFVDEEGNPLGKHKGIIRYTVGQRKGLGIALGSRAFITDIDPATARITVSLENKPKSEFYVSNLVFSGIEPPTDGEIRELSVKVRYQAPLTKATVTFDGEDGAKVVLSEPKSAIAKGQSAVFFDGDMLACGGFIMDVK